MLPQHSVRSDDGGARLSPQLLIAELERSMLASGGNRSNITAMQLAITRTLVNYIDALEARVAAMERRYMGLCDGDDDNPYLDPPSPRSARR